MHFPVEIFPLSASPQAFCSSITDSSRRTTFPPDFEQTIPEYYSIINNNFKEQFTQNSPFFVNCKTTAPLNANLEVTNSRHNPNNQ